MHAPIGLLGGRPPKNYLDCAPQTRKSKAAAATVGDDKFEILHQAREILKQYPDLKVLSTDILKAISYINNAESGNLPLPETVLSPVQ